MRKTAGLIALLFAFPVSLTPFIVSDDPAAAGGAFYGFDDLDESNSMIAVLGDTQVTPAWKFWQEKNDIQTRMILAEIAERFPAAVINLGDLVATGASASNWRTFDDLHAPVTMSRIPYFAVRGNHDYRGPEDVAMEHFGARFPHLKGSPWHAFRFQYAGIILLDSNFRTLGRQQTDEQTHWFEQTLAEMDASPDIRIVICCTHHPPFSNSVTAWPYKEVRKRFVRPFQELTKPGLFFSGHFHTYERFLIAGKHFIVSGGGGGHRGRVRNGQDRRIFADGYKGPSLRPHHFCLLEFGSESLTLRSVHLDSEPSHRFRVADEFAIPIGGSASSRTRPLEPVIESWSSRCAQSLL